jgi:hypothetical protein
MDYQSEDEIENCIKSTMQTFYPEECGVIYGTGEFPEHELQPFEDSARAFLEKLHKKTSRSAVVESAVSRDQVRLLLRVIRLSESISDYWKALPE